MRTPNYIAPIRGSDPPLGCPWEGSPENRRPWQYPITVIIPHLDTPEQIALAVSLWRLSVPEPYIIIVDTGSTEANFARIEDLRSPSVEVHALRLHGVRHASELVSIACDLGMQLCRTNIALHTHSDVFITRRDVPLTFCKRVSHSCPVLGYRMSPRPHPDAKWMLSHTLTGFWMPTADRIGLTWSMRRAFQVLGSDYVSMGDVGVSWPDTETGFNYCLRSAGLKPTFLGDEKNAVRHVDDNIDHCRSLTCSKLYSPSYYEQCMEWVRQATAEAKQRLESWSAEPPIHKTDARGKFIAMIPMPK